MSMPLLLNGFLLLPSRRLLMIAASRNSLTAWLSCCSDEDAINQTLQLIEIFILSAGAGGM